LPAQKLSRALPSYDSTGRTTAKNVISSTLYSSLSTLSKDRPSEAQMSREALQIQSLPVSTLPNASLVILTLPFQYLNESAK
jgi:hypothetical protein